MCATVHVQVPPCMCRRICACVGVAVPVQVPLCLCRRPVPVQAPLSMCRRRCACVGAAVPVQAPQGLCRRHCHRFLSVAPNAVIHKRRGGGRRRRKRKVNIYGCHRKDYSCRARLGFAFTALMSNSAEVGRPMGIV